MEANLEAMLVPGKTPQASFRLDAETIDLLDALGRELGLTRTAVIRLAVREVARQRGIRVPPRAEAREVPDDGE
jgi:antitoxin component of RelBE/YafQ-DinJ toxin-antitoxin module